MRNLSLIAKNIAQTGTIVLIVFLFFLPLVSVAAPIGKVTRVEGRVDVLKVGKQIVAKVTQGDNVDVGDIFRTKTASSAEITFFNMNILRIDPATRVEITRYSMEGDKISQTMKLQRGKVQAISGEEFIKKISSAVEGNKLEVHTPNAVAGIRGSHMVVNFTRLTTALFFRTGKGYFYNPRFPERIVSITGGFMSSITGMNGIPTAPQPASDVYASGNGFTPVFENEPVGVGLLTKDTSFNRPGLLKQETIYVPVAIGVTGRSGINPAPPDPGCVIGCY